jgi:WD40 repeat protein
MFEPQVVTPPSLHLYARALLKTQVAVSVCILVVGFAFLPFDPHLAKTSNLGMYCGAFDTNSRVFVGLFNSEGRGVTNRQFRGYDFKTGRPVMVSQKTVSDPRCVDISHGGRRVFFAHSSGNIYCTAGNGNSFQQCARSPTGNALSLAFAEESQLLIVHDGSGVSAWDVDMQSSTGGTCRWSISSPNITAATLPDGATTGLYCVSANNNSQLWEFEVLTGKPRCIVDSLPGVVAAIATSRDRNQIACVHGAYNLTLLRKSNVHNTWEQHTIPKLCTGVSLLAAFSPDGQLLITGDSSGSGFRGWDLSNFKMLREFDSPHSSAVGVALGVNFLDEHRFVSWHRNGIIHEWDLSKGVAIREVGIKR